ncbi:hypothetical protein ASC78_12730 [Variovorax sp. Root318D1]|uniref:hypothetical protein n=1 Tax=Variovorax sp. Root318D1 TaxID=1736513 RepID=UPI0006FEA778|nr:hypothetical protein [Variovorax sp. Root318D1]KQU83511.1 hypothetical protein ASC78_12730 [Variovorax sp. Root318D1]
MKYQSICAAVFACVALAACRTAPLYEPTRRALVAAEEDEERTVVGQPVPGTAIAQLRISMSYADALKVMGKPNAETVNNTGKAWIPTFNGTDRWRHYLAYKGQGVLVFAGAAGGEIAEISRTKSYTPDVLIQVVHNPKDSGRF